MMGLAERIRRGRAGLADAIGAGRYEEFSAMNAARFRATRRAIAEHARGRVLDVGCGHMPFRSSVLAHAQRYEGLDVEARVPGVDHIGDAQSMTGIQDQAYDTVICLEVLEHLPQPERALSEIARVLRPGGTLVLTVPHLSRLHEEPHDYFRFTRHGLRVVLERAGLEPLDVRPYAGLFSFLAHQLSTIAMGLAWPVPGVRPLVYELNRLALVYPPLWLDRFDRQGLFAVGYVAIARRPNA
jgi:SAM-dependent methyltransferase